MADTRKRKRSKPEPTATDVIVDFIFDEGLFFIAISNLSDRPASRLARLLRR